MNTHNNVASYLFSPYLLPQGKDDFERQQKELLDKENIIKQSQIQLGQEQVRKLNSSKRNQNDQKPCVFVMLWKPSMM